MNLQFCDRKTVLLQKRTSHLGSLNGKDEGDVKIEAETHLKNNLTKILPKITNFWLIQLAAEYLI